MLQSLREKGWTTAAIADAVGVDWYTVRRWVLGVRSPANGNAVLVMLDSLLWQKHVPKRRRVKREA